MKDIFNKAYLEITNVCNLSCSFCKGTDREKCFMTEENFSLAAKELRRVTSYIYFHILGEPTLHPNLSWFLEICHELDFKVIITTNGTLLKKVGDILLSSPALHKVNISLHALEANEKLSFDEYLDICSDFAGKMSKADKICVLRLWNGDSDGKYGSGKLNEGIMSRLEKSFDRSLWKENTKGYRLSDKLFLEFAERFEWREGTDDDSVRCYGLRDQIGVLVDGRIVPCCIDCDGAITLGNIFEDDIVDVINSPLAKQIAEGFRNGRAVHPYCKKCGFVRTRL